MRKIISGNDILVYELFDKNCRENVDITEFEDIIKEEVQDINPELKVIVTPTYFVIMNLIGEYERDIIKGVRNISKHKEVYKYIVVTASKISRLFRRSNAKRRKADIVNLLNTYYNRGGTHYEKK